MPFYTYETVPDRATDSARRYELWQSMKNEPLSYHPETGERLRRVFVAVEARTMRTTPGDPESASVPSASASG